MESCQSCEVTCTYNEQVVGRGGWCEDKRPVDGDVVRTPVDSAGIKIRSPWVTSIWGKTISKPSLCWKVRCGWWRGAVPNQARPLEITGVRCGLDRTLEARDFEDPCGSVDGNVYTRAQTADILVAVKCPCLLR